MQEVHITALGFSSPIGHGWGQHLKAFFQDQHWISLLPYFDTTGAGTRYGGVCKPPDLGLLPQRKLQKLLSPKDLMLVTAVCQAAKTALLTKQDIAGHRQGCFINTGSSQLADLSPYFNQVLECVSDDLQEFDTHKFCTVVTERVNPLAATKVLLNGGLSHVSQILGITGPNFSTMDHEIGTVSALANAVEYLQQGKIERAIVAAVTAPFEPLQLSDHSLQKRLLSFGTGQTLADGLDLFAPYEPHSDGIILAEGACALVLETADSVKRRDCTSLAIIERPRFQWGLDDTSSISAGKLSALVRESVTASNSEEHEMIAVGDGCGDYSHDQTDLECWRQSGLAAVLQASSICGYMMEAQPLWQLALAVAVLNRQQIPAHLMVPALKTASLGKIRQAIVTNHSSMAASAFTLTQV